jgi:ribbon-helix-helix CopG family protein
MPPSRRIRVPLPEALFAALAAAARAQNLPASELVRRAVRADLRRSAEADGRRHSPTSPPALRGADRRSGR